jgi:hypothetical protein
MILREGPSSLLPWSHFLPASPPLVLCRLLAGKRARFLSLFLQPTRPSYATNQATMEADRYYPFPLLRLLLALSTRSSSRSLCLHARCRLSCEQFVEHHMGIGQRQIRCSWPMTVLVVFLMNSAVGLSDWTSFFPLHTEARNLFLLAGQCSGCFLVSYHLTTISCYLILLPFRAKSLWCFE